MLINILLNKMFNDEIKSFSTILFNSLTSRNTNSNSHNNTLSNSLVNCNLTFSTKIKPFKNNNQKISSKRLKNLLINNENIYNKERKEIPSYYPSRNISKKSSLNEFKISKSIGSPLKREKERFSGNKSKKSNTYMKTINIENILQIKSIDKKTALNKVFNNYSSYKKSKKKKRIYKNEDIISTDLNTDEKSKERKSMEAKLQKMKDKIIKYEKLIVILEEKLNKSISIIPELIKQIKYYKDFLSNKEKNNGYTHIKTISSLEDKLNYGKIIEELKNEKLLVSNQKEKLILGFLKDKEKKETKIENLLEKLDNENEILINIQNDNIKLKKEIEKDKELITKKDQQMSQLQQKIYMLNKKINSVEFNNLNLIKSKKEMELKLTKNQKELEKVKEEIGEIKEKYKLNELSNVKLKEEIERLKKFYEEKIKNLSEEYEKEKINFITKKESLIKIQSSLEKENDDLKKEKEIYEKEKNNLIQIEVEKIKEEFEKEIALKDEEIDEIEKELEYKFSLKENEYEQIIRELKGEI